MTARIKNQKQKNLLISCAFLFFVGCSKQDSPSESRPALGAAQDTAPVSFEVRDFAQTREFINTGPSSFTRYLGRGTLVTRDTRLSTGHAQVWLHADTTSTNEPTWRSEVEIEDGIGTINTYGSLMKGEPEPLEFKNWAVLGYYYLKPAALVDSNASAAPVAKASEKTSVPRFQIRDYSQKEDANRLGSIAVSGKGTLVALDEAVKRGLYLVKMKTHRTNTSNADGFSIVMLRDGIGSVNTFVVQSKEDTARGKVQYDRWSIVGYTPLSTGRVVSLNGVQQASANEASGTEAQFEIRDFALQRQDFAGVGAKVFGRGTLVAKDSNLKTGNVVVWIKCHVSQYGGSTMSFTLVLREGIATINTEHLEFKSDPESKVTFSNWEIVGYTPLLKGEIVQPGTGK